MLVSHELFHAVQAAYRPELSSWMSEGSAVWAEHVFDSELWDYYGQCGYYLEEPTRSLDRPPAGMVSGFSYGTAIFFDFLSLQLGSQFWSEYFALLGADQGALELDVLEEHLFTYEALLSSLWPIFSQWNLATGYRSGMVESTSMRIGLKRLPWKSRPKWVSTFMRPIDFFP